MKNRISQLFNNLMGEERAGLGIFITAGDPNLEISQKNFDMQPNFRADFIELVMPFSDPMADRPAIQ